MRREVDYRPSWRFRADALRHNFFINDGLYLNFFGHPLFLNFKLIWMCACRGHRDIVLAASWNDPDVLAIVALKRLGLVKARLHFWSEANYLTLGARNDNIIKRFMRKFCYNLPGTIQLSSGRMTEITLRKWGVTSERSIFLPNTIQEDTFEFKDEYKSIRRSNEKPIIVIVGRLIERVKGILNFLSALDREDFDRCLIIVAGDGEDRGKITNFIVSNGLEESVLLVGDLASSELARLYARANIFCLPSFTDASPLALVEALSMRLPVLVSSRCGNHYEAVKIGENGYLFDPDDKGGCLQAFRRMLDRRDDWETMGESSGALFEATFRQSVVITKFLGAGRLNGLFRE